MSGHAVVTVWYSCSTPRVHTGCGGGHCGHAQGSQVVGTSNTSIGIFSTERDLLGPVLLKIRGEER